MSQVKRALDRAEEALKGYMRPDGRHARRCLKIGNKDARCSWNCVRTRTALTAIAEARSELSAVRS